MWSAHNSSSSSSEGSSSGPGACSSRSRTRRARSARCLASSGCDMKSSSDMSIPASPRTRTNEATGYSSVRLAGYDTPIGKRNDSAVQCSLGGEVGDRGMITGTRIDDLRKLDGMGWITALKAPAIAKLARDDGPLQMSLFDTHNFAEITHPDYPGERLICCHNPVLAADRARTREELLAATETGLAKIKASADAGRLKDPDKIGIRAGKVINKRK